MNPTYATMVDVDGNLNNIITVPHHDFAGLLQSEKDDRQSVCRRTKVTFHIVYVETLLSFALRAHCRFVRRTNRNSS